MAYLSNDIVINNIPLGTIMLDMTMTKMSLYVSICDKDQSADILRNET